MADRESAQEVYDRFAPAYDKFTSANNYEMWLGEILLPELEKHGLQRGWALDVGCGTGRAFEPLLDRGWEVVGCDASAGMLAQAREKFGDRVQLIHGDARELEPISTSPDRPSGESFQLVLLLNEVVNYLTEDGDLERAFAGICRNLSREGLVVFDVNTLRWFRDSFASGKSEELSERGWDWHGLSETVERGATFEMHLCGQGVKPYFHRERHWTPEQVEEALEAAGLRPLAALGQREESWQVILESGVDEERDSKVIHIAGRSS
ncbi:MAG TPA: class I SAM-dependent methyltransferase [Solirubrobacterales bacterium]|nr:class I SAM-dependent methyltransferase [Solirubrobacterales bacterium]